MLAYRRKPRSCPPLAAPTHPALHHLPLTRGIALRCGQITENEMRIFAGCGIVAGSSPEKELSESNAKFAPMRSALA